MYILGMNDSNSAAALIQDGNLVAAVREERFDRIKFSDVFPSRAVDYCLKTAGIGLKDLDSVVFAWNPGHELEPQDSRAAVRYHKHFLHYIPNNLLGHIGGDKGNKRIASISETLRFIEGEIKIHFVPHHFAHAASAFFVSPFEKAAVLTIDAYGDDITQQFFVGEGNRLRAIGQTHFPHSLGQVYAAMTQYLGFRPNADEWKVMGLAAYGRPAYQEVFSHLIRFDRERGELRFNLDYFSFYIWSPRRYTDQFTDIFGQERHPGQELTQHHMDIAAGFQQRVEEVVLEMCAFLKEKTGLDDLCLAGGVVMNSKMNGRIEQEAPFSRVWIQPSADDAGCSLGACFFHWCQVLDRPRRLVMEHDYWGPGFSDDEIRRLLEDAMIPYQRLDEPETAAAGAIADNKIIAWFQGRMELGQRALGNRSILADPRDPKMKEKINRLIKHREWFRPFAPSVLAEYQGEFFESDRQSPFMQKVVVVRPEKRGAIPAVVHQDGTGRIQTVTRTANPRYWKLIEQFRSITGIPLILNTSFNDNDEPIVCTPKDALRTFFGTGLHELYMGSYRIRKTDLQN